MGLNSRGTGRGCGANRNFPPKDRNGRMSGQGLVFRSGPPGIVCSPTMVCSPQVPFGGPPCFGSPSGGNFASLKPFHGKFPRKNFKRNFPLKNYDAQVLEIDLTKPWVTEEIKNEESKKQELLTTWRISKDDEIWSKYKTQKLNVQSLYENAKTEYIASHPNEVAFWKNVPHSKKLFCETCDKSFRTDDDLIIHESEHETCGRDGCKFTAHPKIISKHIKMQHDSGLFGRIGVLYTKEDIAKWIEERKKRYPTKKLVEEKKAMEEEKMNRGERIKDDNPRFSKSFKNRNKKEMKKKFEKKTKSRNRRQKKKKKNSLPTPVEDENLPSEKRSVPAFHGIKDPAESEHFEENQNEKDNLGISDDEWETETKHDVLEPVLNGSLGLLAAAYDSEEENRNIENVQKKEEQTVSDDEGSAPEEVATVHRKSPPPEDLKAKTVLRKRKVLDKNTRQHKRIKSNFTERSPESRSLTLLEKLLKDEIRHERNVILQCVHYVVKNNFFKT